MFFNALTKFIYKLIKQNILKKHSLLNDSAKNTQIATLDEIQSIA